MKIQIPETALKPISIETKADMERGARALTELNRYLDAITLEKEKLTKPLNEALREIRGRYKDIEGKLESAIRAVRTEMARFQTKAIAERKKAEERLAKKVAKGAIDLEQAVSLAVSTGPLERISAGPGGASVSFRTDRVLKVVKASIVPREYLMVDEKKALEALKRGEKVPGCVLEEVQVVVSKR